MSLPLYTKSTLLWSNYIMTAKIVYNKLPEKFFGVANMTWKKKRRLTWNFLRVGVKMNDSDRNT